MPLTLHLVPHTHWDREWYLTFQQFRIRLVHLMDRLLDILAHDASFRHFMLDGQAILLEDYLEIRPQRADEVARLVRAGRLAIGPWYVLPDEFLVAPESLLRNLMLGDRVCRRFGARMPVGYIPDPFGHVGQLPQILRGFGIESAAFRRGLAEEPAELWWDAPDGSRVLVSYLRDGYDNAAFLPVADPEAFVAAIRESRDSLAPHVTSGHLLLLAGTDHQEPQPELPALVVYASDGRLGESRLIHSSLPAYVAAVRQAAETRSLERVSGELRSPQRHHLLPGVLSARMGIKQRNDAIETLLTRWAEPFAAWAELLDAGDAMGLERHVHLTGHEPLSRVRRPGALIWHAWRLLLANHPHDSICGCSVDQVHREMLPRFDQAEQVGQEITAQSLTAIAAQVDTSGDAPGPLVVFNASGGPRTDVVAARLRLPDAPDALEVVGPDGRVVPHQVVADPGGRERPFFHLEATPAEIMTYMGLVQGGRVLNHVIHEVQLHRADDQVHVLLVLGESGAPDQAHLALAQAQIEGFIATGDVGRFLIRTVIAEPSELVFIAPDLPPYGYATFNVCSARQAHALTGQQPSHAGLIAFKREETSGSPILESDPFVLQVDPSDGTLTLTDKHSGVVYPGLNRFVDGGDRGDAYNYCQPEEERLVAAPVAPPGIRLLEEGPARGTLEIAQVYRLPRSLRPDRRGRLEETVDLPIVSRVSLYPGVGRVDIETTVDNLAQDHRLRVHFPLPVRADHAHTEAHFYVARRPIPQTPQVLKTAVGDTSDWVEQPVPTVPQRGWADLSDGQVGLMIVNRGLPEVEFIPDGEQTIIALTLLRCVGWLSRDDMHCRQGHAGPELPTPEAQCPGRHTFHYALIPHAVRQDCAKPPPGTRQAVRQDCAKPPPGTRQASGWEQARVQAEAFRAPPRAVAAGVHAGPLPPVASLVRVEPPSFALTAIKQPEEGETPGLVVRGVNLSARPATVRLRPWRGFNQAARVNLNEEFLEALALDEDRAVAFGARAWEIVTVKWSD
jgi:hypothetical protein